MQNAEKGYAWKISKNISSNHEQYGDFCGKI
jgi:hypothetical protein